MKPSVAEPLAAGLETLAALPEDEWTVAGIESRPAGADGGA